MRKIDVDLDGIDPDLVARFKAEAKGRGMTLEEAVDDAMLLLFTGMAL